ncbi:methyltransferase-like protein 5 [Nannochloropsis gaditana]|uniref:Methyltransferase-like protein 5 n=1 Tax=Nannochloropsis gaditana TaxID=72520 RepID=W7T693_9STRA|nr:methyltransferase-like protein 5 [Nannochloropsis gaditana]
MTCFIRYILLQVAGLRSQGMKLRHLESFLSQVDGFEAPKWGLEQYLTPPHLAARVLHCVASYDDLEGCAVADLGCGTGMLLAGAALMDCDETLSVGVDADPDALSTARGNLDKLELNFSLLQADIVVNNGLPFRRVISEGSNFDTVIMNPPFGTKNQGVDMLFVRRALAFAPIVYSLHKTSTRDFLMGCGAAGCGKHVQAEVIANMQFEIPATYSFHKQKSVNIDVDLFRFSRRNSEDMEEAITG